MWGVPVPPESHPMKMRGWKVSRNDLTKVTASQNGYLLIKNSYIEHYRSESAIFEDKKKVREVMEKLDDFVIFLAHTRAASQGEKNMFNVQPFAFSTKRGFIFWTMHNGDLNKNQLVRMGELNPVDVEGASDSYVMGVYLCRFLEGIEKEHLLNRFKEIKATAKSLMNTVTLLMSKASLNFYSWRY